MRKQRTGWLLMAPTLILLTAVGFVPFVYVLVVSFFDWNLFGANPDPVFNGLDNFRRLVTDERVVDSLWKTLLFALWAVSSQLLLGYVLARLMLRDFPGKQLFRTIHTLPLLVAPIAVGAVWRLLVVPGLGPLPTYFENWFGYEFNLGTNATLAFILTVVMDIWHWTPFVTLTLLAGLGALPSEPFESALVDGANSLQTFFFVTLPLLKPVVIATTFIRLMDALRTVDEVLMLTGGGPSDSTRYLGLQITRIVFERSDYGYGSAVSVFALYVTILISWLLYTVFVTIGQRAALDRTARS